MCTFPCRYFCQDDPLKTKISDEESCTIWMVQHITASNIMMLQNEHLIQSLYGSSSTHLHLPATGTLKALFWNHFQLTCILWNQILTDKHVPKDSLIKKLSHATRVATSIFEQSPQDIQSSIIENILSSSNILILCVRVAIAAIQGIIMTLGFCYSDYMFNINLQDQYV